MFFDYRKIPMPIGGMALGLAALGILFKKFSIIYWVCGFCSLMCLTLLGIRIVLDLKGFKKDFENPIFASVSAAGLMAVMQLSTYIAPFFYKIAFTIWILAIALHIGIMIIVFKRFILKLDLNVYFPTFFITYVGIIVASVTSPFYHMEKLGQIIFWFGFITYLMLFIVITIRYINVPVAESARPLFCIYAAPMSLSLVGYLSVMDKPSIVFVSAMAILAQILLLVVIFKIPNYLRLRFYPSFAAMTFPFVISCTGLMKTLAFLNITSGIFYEAFHFLIALEAILAATMVFYVFSKYCRWICLTVFNSSLFIEKIKCIKNIHVFRTE